MRTLGEIQQDILYAEINTEIAQKPLNELEDEYITVKNYEAKRRECLNCDGTGLIECLDDVKPEDWFYAYCPVCEGRGKSR